MTESPKFTRLFRSALDFGLRAFLHASDRGELSSELAMGGQAVIEGVMMRSPNRVAIACRKPDGEIVVRSYPYVPVTRRIKALGLPIVRGAVGMIEALKIGTDALTWSAEQQMTDEDKGKQADPKSWKAKLGMAVSLALAFAFGLGLFMYLPYWVARITVGEDQGQFYFHLMAGAIRVSLLLGYLATISLWKDIRRVFQYHGSEHKTIFAFETGGDLNTDRVLKQTRFHPRCGTSFLLIVALSAILFFVIVDTIWVALVGPYGSVLVRFLVHLPLIPFVAGLSYEFLKFSAKHTENKLVWWLIQPGLWLQRITTKEPDGGMCEVAITALKGAVEAPAAAAKPESASAQAA